MIEDRLDRLDAKMKQMEQEQWRYGAALGYYHIHPNSGQRAAAGWVAGLQRELQEARAHVARLTGAEERMRDAAVEVARDEAQAFAIDQRDENARVAYLVMVRIEALPLTEPGEGGGDDGR